MRLPHPLFALALSLLLTALCTHASEAPSAAAATPTTDTFQLPSPAFAPQTFHITVYLPPGYVQGSARYPVLYANDGQDMPAVGLQATLANLYARHAIASVIVVAVDALPDRLALYGLFDRARRRSVVGGSRFGAIGAQAQPYAQWFVDTLVPTIDARYRTNPVPADRAVLGWPLGALSAFGLGWNDPDVFGTVGAFSPSFWVAGDRADARAVQHTRLALRMVDRGAARPALRWWFSIGAGEETSDRDGDGVIDAVDDLRQLGYRVVEGDPAHAPRMGQVALDAVPGAHHEQKAWAAVLPDFLRWAFPPRG
jgi:enterochelin esterase-like enzyme